MKSNWEQPTLIDKNTPRHPDTSYSTGQARQLDLIITLGVPVLLLGLALWDIPAEPTWTICGFRNLTGLPCPGCGITRGLSALLHGKWLRAIHFNPLAILALLLLVIMWLRSLCALSGWNSTLNRIEGLWRHRRVLTWSLLLAVGAFWVWRVGSYLEVKGFQAAVQEGWLFRLFHQVLT